MAHIETPQETEVRDSYAALQRENERLRAALEKIATLEESDMPWIRKIANEALS